jgi:hypothetical protein
VEFDLAKWEPEVVENVYNTSLDVRPRYLSVPITCAEAAPARPQCEEWECVAQELRERDTIRDSWYEV